MTEFGSNKIPQESPISFIIFLTIKLVTRPLRFNAKILKKSGEKRDKNEKLDV